MKHVVYAIVDPRTSAVFYIGQTSNLRRRRKQHLKLTDSLSGLVIRQILDAKRKPAFVILEHCPSLDAALMAEIAWIEFFKCRGTQLMNAQAFPDVTSRNRQRKKLERTSRFQSHLRRIANGHGYSETAPSPWKDDKHHASYWSRRDMARLRGLKKAGVKPGAIAQILKRPAKAIREKLSSL